MFWEFSITKVQLKFYQQFYSNRPKFSVIFYSIIGELLKIVAIIIGSLPRKFVLKHYFIFEIIISILPLENYPERERESCRGN